MRTQSMLLAAMASAPAALAHTVFTDWMVDGTPVGDGVAIRMNQRGEDSSSPIASLHSTDMACNVGGDTGVSRVESVPDGATLTFEIRSWPNDPSKERLDRGHKGPCAVYLKKVDSAVEAKGSGDGWFKLFDHGYDADTDRWCTDEIIDNDGLLSMRLPEGLEGGYYLARPEILALHAAIDRDPQFYTGCAQMFLESSGNLVPESTVSIPGYVDYDQEATSFDIYNRDNAEYTMPGPKVAKLTSGSSVAVSSRRKSQTEGLKPKDCLVENANWCGKEVADYSDEKGCWDSAEDCWDQLDTCYDESLPTGNKGCEAWEKKCEDIGAQCEAGNFNGPPNKGETLSPEPEKVDVGLVLGAKAAVVESSPQNNAAKEEATTSEASKSTPAATSNAPAATPTEAYNDDSSSSSSSNEDEDSKTQASPAPASGEYPAETPSPVATITVPSSEDGPAPTANPACPDGYQCVTVYTTAVVTQTEYKTVYPDMKKRAALHQRRHHH